MVQPPMTVTQNSIFKRFNRLIPTSMRDLHAPQQDSQKGTWAALVYKKLRHLNKDTFYTVYDPLFYTKGSGFNLGKTA